MRALSPRSEKNCPRKQEEDGAHRPSKRVSARPIPNPADRVIKSVETKHEILHCIALHDTNAKRLIWTLAPVARAIKLSLRAPSHHMEKCTTGMVSNGTSGYMVCEDEGFATYRPQDRQRRTREGVHYKIKSRHARTKASSDEVSEKMV
jgi:hypothetical protein